MEDALFGTEIEYGCVGSVPPVRAAVLVKDAIFRGCRHGLIDPPPREWGEVPGNGGFLFNGGRMYLDLGHLEHATAECRTLTDIVAHERAGENIVNQAVQGCRTQVSGLLRQEQHRLLRQYVWLPRELLHPPKSL